MNTATDTDVWTEEARERYLADVREVGWVAREARLMVEGNVPQDSDRWRAYDVRKRALLRRIAADKLVQLHAAAVAADRHTGQETTRATVEASLAAHQALTDACEVFRREHYPRAGRVFAAFGEVFTVSPAGRKITRVYPAHP